MKKYLDWKKYTLVYVAVLQILLITLIFGCNPTTSTSSWVDLTATPISSPFESQSSFSELTPEIACQPILSEVISSEDGIEISNYLWSEDGEYFYYEDGETWWQLSIDNYEISLVSAPKALSQLLLPAFAKDYLSHLDESVLRHQIAISPSQEQIIYWENPNQSGIPIPTVEPNDLVQEYEFPRDVFLFQENESLPLHIGKIDYPIRQAYWFPDEERILLEMGGVGEHVVPTYHLWLLDVTKRTITPFLSSAETQAPKFRTLDISPDGHWIMYQTSVDENIILKNVYNLKTKSLNDIPRSLGAWWLPDSERILAVAIRDQGYFSVLMYTMVREETTKIVPDIRSEGRPSVSLGISREKIVLAFIDSLGSGSDRLLMLDLCPFSEN